MSYQPTIRGRNVCPKQIIRTVSNSYRVWDWASMAVSKPAISNMVNAMILRVTDGETAWYA